MEIFEKEPYTSRFRARVEEIREQDGKTILRLDSTAFFPGGGGQGCDTGKITWKGGEARVAETYEREGKIWHVCSSSVFQIGEEVDCEIDWDRRHTMMKSHTGEHTLFHALSDVFPGISMVKVQIAPEGSSIFVRHPGELPLDGILPAEKKVKEIISNGLAVTVNAYPKDSIPPGTRAKLDRIDSDSVRVVMIGSFDSCACAGIHVKNTSEIGALAVTGVTSEGTGAYKISFLVGSSAINYLLETKLAAQKASSALNTTTDKLERTAMNIRLRNDSLEKSAREMGEQILSKLEPERVGSVELYLHSFSNFDSKKLMEKAGELIRKDGVLVLFSNTDEEKGQLILAKSQNLKTDLRGIGSKAFTLMNGKGGGKENFVTGAGEVGKLGEALKLVVGMLKDSAGG